MKKIFSISFLFIVLFLFYSCARIFHDEELGYLKLDEQQKKIDLLNGMYSRLVAVHSGGYFLALIRSDDINYYTTLNCTDLGGYINEGTELSIDFQLITNRIYRNLYSLIITANTLIPKLSESEDDKKISGEAHFLRAYAYFKLARLFGNPPLIKDVDVSYSIRIPSYVQVYEFIEQDLLKALELLPDNPQEARIPEETPHKGTVKALLAEVYLNWGGFPIMDESKFDYAVKFAGDVIDNAEHYNFGLLSDIADLWTVKSRHNKENIFGLFFSSTGVKRDTSNIYDIFGTENNINSLFSLLIDVEASKDGAHHIYTPEFWFYNKFPLSYRKRCFLPVTYYHYPWNIRDTIYNLVNYPCGFVHEAFFYKWLDRDTVNKYIRNTFAPYSIAPIAQGSQITLYLLRYVQTLLTYAEAKAKTGVLDDKAYEAVNMVRRRANKLDISLPSPYDLKKDYNFGRFIDSVVWERAWELCFEPDGRWFDIIRLNLRKQLYINVLPNDVIMKVPENILNEDFWYFYKIPEADRYIF